MEKDLKLRKQFMKAESLHFVQRAILKNQVLSMPLRVTLSTRWYETTPNRYRTRIKNYCVLTGRSRSYIRFFRLSRIKMRELASKGILFGVSKASW